MQRQLLAQCTEAAQHCLKDRKHVPTAFENSEVQIEREREKEKEKQKELEQQVMAQHAKPIPEKYRRWAGIPFTEDMKKERDEETAGEARNAGVHSINTMLEGVPQAFKPSFKFNDNIFVSQNYQVTNALGDKNLLDKKKPLNFVLYVQTPEPDSTLKAVLLTEEDAVELKKMIKYEKEKLERAKYRVAIMSTHETPLIRTAELINHPDYFAIYEQICYFNADLDLLSKNPGRLHWLLENSEQKMKFLAAQLLRSYPEKAGLSTALMTAFGAVATARQLEKAITEEDIKTLGEVLQKIMQLQNPYIRKSILNATTNQGRGLLNLAVSSKNPGLLQALLQTGEINPLKVDALGQIPLVSALAANNEVAIQALLKAGLPDSSDVEAWNALLYFASSLKNTDYFNKFYDLVAHFKMEDEKVQILNKAPRGFDKPLMHLLIEEGNITVLSALLKDAALKDTSVRLGATDKAGFSALELAFKKNNAEIISLVMNPRFLPAKDDRERWQSLLAIALQNNNIPQIEFILKSMTAHCDWCSSLLFRNHEAFILKNSSELLSLYFRYVEQAMSAGDLIALCKVQTHNEEVEYLNLYKMPEKEVKLMPEGPFALAITHKLHHSLQVLMDNPKIRPKAIESSEESINQWVALLNAVIAKKDKESLKIVVDSLKQSNLDPNTRSAIFRGRGYGGYSPLNALFVSLATLPQEKKQTQELKETRETKETKEFLKTYLQIPDAVPKPDSEEDWKKLWRDALLRSQGRNFAVLKELLESLPLQTQVAIMQTNPDIDRLADFPIMLTNSENTEALEYILKRNDVFNVVENQEKSSVKLLHLAATKHNLNALKVLLADKRFYPNIKSSRGVTTLMCLFQYSITPKQVKEVSDCLELLLQHNIDLDAKDRFGRDIVTCINSTTGAEELVTVRNEWLKMIADKKAQQNTKSEQSKPTF